MKELTLNQFEQAGFEILDPKDHDYPKDAVTKSFADSKGDRYSVFVFETSNGNLEAEAQFELNDKAMSKYVQAFNIHLINVFSPEQVESFFCRVWESVGCEYYGNI